MQRATRAEKSNRQKSQPNQTATNTNSTDQITQHTANNFFFVRCCCRLFMKFLPLFCFSSSLYTRRHCWASPSAAIWKTQIAKDIHILTLSTWNFFGVLFCNFFVRSLAIHFLCLRLPFDIQTTYRMDLCWRDWVRSRRANSIQLRWKRIPFLNFRCVLCIVCEWVCVRYRWKKNSRKWMKLFLFAQFNLKTRRRQ